MITRKLAKTIEAAGAALSIGGAAVSIFSGGGRSASAAIGVPTMIGWGALAAGVALLLASFTMLFALKDGQADL